MKTNAMVFRILAPLVVVILLLALPRAMADDLPELGDVSRESLSPQLERRIGEDIMREIRADRSYLEDPELTDYLNNLGYRLASNSPDVRQEFEFFVIQDPTINAFALPGGFIGVHSGLFTAAQTESELASVLAHEIAHVTQKHLARMIAGQKKTMLTSLAALAVAILAARSNSQVSEAAIAAAQASSIQTQLDFTREHEREADRIGLQILTQAGFDPRAMAAFFDRMQKATRVYETGAPSYLRTHPMAFERIADIQNRLQSLPYHQVSDSLEFQMLRAKVRANQDSPRDAVAYFAETLRDKRYGSEVAHRYGLVTALLRAKDYGQADKEIAGLRKLAPPNALVETLTGQVKVAAGQLPAALDFYRAALRAFPQHRALVYDYADALLQSRQPDTALKLVTGQSKSYPDDAQLYQLQARCYAALGKSLLQHQAQAEAYVRRGNIVAAIDQLQIALKSGDGDFYQLSSAEARLRELRRIDAANRKQ